MMTSDITAFIIGGGKSRRFGENKLLYKYKGITLIERVISVLKQVFDEIVIVSNKKDELSFTGLPIIPDAIPDIGPIGGIYSALNYSKTEKIFCFAGDIPNLNKDLIGYMISISNRYDVVTPYLKGYYESLYTIYLKTCIKFIEDQIPSGNYQVIHFFEYCNLRKVREDEISRFTSPDVTLKNINTKEDLE